LPNATHFIDAKLKPVNRVDVKRIVRTPPTHARGLLMGATRMHARKSLAALRAQAMEIEYGEVMGERSKRAKCQVPGSRE